MDELDIFLKALDQRAGEPRAAWLDESCGIDTPLRARLEKLLLRHEQSGGFLESPAAHLEVAIRSASLDRENGLSRVLDAGLSPAFSDEAAVVVGRAGHSVLASLGQTVDVPRVVLRDSPHEKNDPVSRPSTSEMPPRAADSRYRLDGEIARGGMGAILKGRDIDLGRDLAIKVLLDEHKDKPDVIQRFVEEAQIGGQLQHPGIAPVYELGQFSDQRPFISMKLVKGQTLANLLADRSEPSAAGTSYLGIFEQVCQTMAYAHSRGVIHRDLKPANIMVGAFGEVQVVDWGLAKVLRAGGVADEKKSRQRQGQSIIQTMRSAGGDAPGKFGSVGSQTQMGMVMGTPAYMPPEQALGEVDNLDERSDVFALGAILCEILTGQPPYVADEGAQVYRLASRGKLEDCYRRLDASGCEDDLVNLAKDCLQLEPADRPHDAGVLAERVTAYLQSVETRLREAELARVDAQVRAEELRRRHRQAFTAGAAIVASLVIGMAASAWQAVRADREAAKARLAEQRAIAALDELRTTAPAFAEQARALAATERFDEAIAKLDYAVALRPDVAEYLVAKADLLQCQLKLAEAAAMYREALRVEPGLARAEASAQLCDELLAAGRADEGALSRESLARLHLAMERQQRPAAELMPVARQLGKEKELMVRYWLARLQGLPVSADRPLSDRLAVRADGRLALDLSGTRVLDLSPLAGAPLAVLNLSGIEEPGELADITSLHGLDLVELDISRTNVTDLAPLRDMHTLARLKLSRSQVTDLSPLGNLRLKSLDLQGCAVTDLAPIQGMPLDEINLRHTRVVDILPLVGMPITSIDLSETPVLDFSPLARLPLEKCYFKDNRITDLAVLRGRPLKELVLWGCNAARNYAVLTEIRTLELLLLPSQYRTLPSADYEAIGALRSLPKLRQLGPEYIGGAGYAGAGVLRLGVAETEFIGGTSYAATGSADEFWQDWDREQTFLPALRASGFNFSLIQVPGGLYSLRLYHQAITDLSMLKGAPLGELWMIQCPVSDLTPLRGMPLEVLNVRNNPISDIRPLEGMPLTRLFLTGTAVSDLSPLAGLPLKDLYLDNCRNLTDVAPLVEIPTLENLIVPPHVANIETLRAHPRLQRLGFVLTGNVPMLPETSAVEFWQAYRWLEALHHTGSATRAPQRLGDGTWHVNLDNTGITDLAILRGAAISQLSAQHMDVSDLAPLAGMPLRKLWLANTRITDLSPLVGMPLEELSLRGTPVNDLSALRGAPLRSLWLSGCRALTDLRPLDDCMELRSIVLPPHATKIEFLRTLPKLERISFDEDRNHGNRPDKTAAEFWREFDENERQALGRQSAAR